MSHIGSRAEYGLHCLLHLTARTEAEAPGARDLAEFQGVSPSYLAKVFTALEKAGLVASAEGIHGGFRLARPPRDISVLDVVDTVEGRKPLFVCRDIRRTCVLHGDTPPAAATTGIRGINAIMREAGGAMREALARHTPADIARGVTAKLPAHLDGASSRWFASRARKRTTRNPNTKNKTDG